jgi:hypothetical protein
MNILKFHEINCSVPIMEICSKRIFSFLFDHIYEEIQLYISIKERTNNDTKRYKRHV